MPPAAPPARPAPGHVILDIRNRVASFGWGFMVVWLGMLLAFSWILVRDGPDPSQPAWLQQGAIALFWIFGAPAAGYIFSLPCTRLRVDAEGSVVLTRRTPFTREVETYARGSLAAIEVRAGKDSEGDPYWETFMVARDGRERMIREGHVPAEQEALAARLREALGLPLGPA